MKYECQSTRCQLISANSKNAIEPVLQMSRPLHKPSIDNTPKYIFEYNTAHSSTVNADQNIEPGEKKSEAIHKKGPLFTSSSNDIFVTR